MEEKDARVSFLSMPTTGETTRVDSNTTLEIKIVLIQK